MLDAPQRRRLVSPALLLAALLCFFLPFFSVSCTSGVGQMKATVTGMDQVFGGQPEYTGFRPPPSATGATTPDGVNSRVSPSAVIGFAATVAGIGVGLGLPRPRARWMSGAVAGGIALVAVVVNQVMIHDRAREGLDRAESTFRSQLADNPIFDAAIPVPVFDLADELGFWVVTVLLGLAVAYNVWEVVALQRGPSRLGSTADSTDGAQAVPLPSANSDARGWPQGPPPQGPRQ